MPDADPHLKDRLLNDLSSSLDRGREEPLMEGPGAAATIPDHTLLRRIGKGSYGEVWLARNVMGTLRAVKIVYRRAFDSDRPYEREFAGIRRFEPVSRTHPSQLQVLHVGRDDAAGYFYYVMELADDSSAECKVQSAESKSPSSVLNDESYAPRTLRSELEQQGALPYGECLAIGTALATALDHLHRHGLVHRDIKPSNIIFVNGLPKLADIGLVTHVEATASFVGTEGFVPPEGPGTPQADIYSLGKVIYEMATGRDRQEYPELPTNLISRSEAERAGLEELNDVVVRACEAEPRRRYGAAADLHADLALLQSGRSVTRMRQVERRLRWVARAGALVTGVALVAGGAFLYQRQATEEARRLANDNRALAEEKGRLATANQSLLTLEEAARVRAVEAEQVAVAERNRALQSEENTERVLEFLLRRVVSAARPPDDDGEGLGREVTLLQALQAAEPLIPEAFAGQPLAERKLRQSLADTFSLLGLATNEVANRERVLALSVAQFGSTSLEAISNRQALAEAYRDAGRTNELLLILQQNWETASQALGPAHEATLGALVYLGVAYREVGQLDASIRLLEEGQKLSRQALGDADVRTLGLLNALGWTYHRAHQSERAVPLLEETFAGRQKALGRDHEDTTRAMLDLARAYLAVGREREAFAMLHEGYEIRRRAQGPRHYATLIAMDVLARSYERAGRTNDALAWHSLALELREQKLGPNQRLAPGMSSTFRTRKDVLRLRAVLEGSTNQPVP